MPTKKIRRPAQLPADELVPDPQAAREFNVTRMTWWRWGQDPALIALGFPPRIKIRERNFRSRKAIDAFKERLMRSALAQRGQQHAATGAGA